jgi:predicted NAD/FAD-dependent oxidoreductase
VRVVVVGAGLSGLMAAGRLHANDHDVIVLDKGRSPGGRMATRRIEVDAGTARFDHGAQFFTVRTDEVALLVRAWTGLGLVREWCRGFTHGSADPGTASTGTTSAGTTSAGTSGDGFPRYVVDGGMSALAKHLARDLDVRCSTLVFAIRPGEGPSGRAWTVALDDGTSLDADAVVVTCPLPQAYALLVTSGVALPDDLLRTEYDRTIGLLAVLDRPGAVPSPGGVQRTPTRTDDTHDETHDETQDGAAGSIFSWIGDNTAKGISDVPALTFHADPQWSEQHWDDSLSDLESALREAASPWLGTAGIVTAQVKKWRFATPHTLWPDPCWVGGTPEWPATIVLAGDAFDGPRVEGAIRSGLAAADALLAPPLPH